MTDASKILTLQVALSDLLISVQTRRPSLGEIAVATAALAETLGTTVEELHAENARIAARRNWSGTRMPPVEAAR